MSNHCFPQGHQATTRRNRRRMGRSARAARHPEEDHSDPEAHAAAASSRAGSHRRGRSSSRRLRTEGTCSPRDPSRKPFPSPRSPNQPRVPGSPGGAPRTRRHHPNPRPKGPGRAARHDGEQLGNGEHAAVVGGGGQRIEGVEQGQGEPEGKRGKRERGRLHERVAQYLRHNDVSAELGAVQAAEGGDDFVVDYGTDISNYNNHNRNYRNNYRNNYNKYNNTRRNDDDDDENEDDDDIRYPGYSSWRRTTTVSYSSGTLPWLGADIYRNREEWIVFRRDITRRHRE